MAVPVPAIPPAAAVERSSSQPAHAFAGGTACDLTLIAAKYGTPLYVYDARFLINHLARVQRELASDRIRLLYSMKANAGLEIVRTMLRMGFALDVCSPGDVFIALKAGAREDQLSYTGVGLCAAQIADLLDRGIHVNLDSLSEVRRLPQAPVQIGLRIAPDVSAGFHEHCQAGRWGQKFGMYPSDAMIALEQIAPHGGVINTLHCHIGSSIDRIDPFVDALDVLLRQARRLPDVTTINLGGGINPVFTEGDRPFPLSALREAIEGRLAAFEIEEGRSVTVMFEPGELLISEAACLLTRVMVTKVWTRPKLVRTAILDASMNLMPACTLFGSRYRIEAVAAPADDASIDENPREVWTLYGNTNQTGDVLAKERPLPFSLQEDDLLLIRNAGAYAYVRSTTFNERPRPAEVWIEAESDRVVRPAETTDDLFR